MSRHGIVRAVDTHFEYEDGTYYYPFGTTIYALAHQSRELIDKTFETLKNSPFNKVRMCVFPKHYQYNNNEPVYYPFAKRQDGTWDTGRPLEAFWDNLESIIQRLDELDIECDLILFHSYDNWGFATMGMEANFRYLEYCLERLGHLDNVWWSLANEYDLLLSEISMEQWEEIEQFVSEHNPRGHLLSNHNCFRTWDMGRRNITHGSYQIKNLSILQDRLLKYNKPICVDECCYEGNLPSAWGNLPATEMVARFWQAIASGAYCTHGETFLDDNDAIWWSKGGVLKGQSPERIAFLREIVEHLPGPICPYVSDGTEFLDNLPDEVRESFAKAPSGRSFPLTIAQADHDEHILLSACEHTYQGRTKDNAAILKYYDIHCQAYDTLRLPKDRKYRVEVIDTFDMTKKTVCENASGMTRVELTGKPYCAVLATAVV